MRRVTTGTTGLLMLLAAAPLLSACSATVTCYDWAAYESTKRMLEDATVVVDVDELVPAGTSNWSGVTANVYDARIDEAVAGDVRPGEVLRVLSTPETCSASTYPQDDPMRQDAPLRLYLVEDDAVLRTLTPFAGVERR